jgi:dolichyl-phosphate-mannose-protein mannosyltransferase
MIRAARRRAGAWLAQYGVDTGLCMCVVLLTLFVRWASLERIESGGDPLDNWFFVKQWAHNTGLFSGYLNHHNSRFGIHWLTWIVQRVFGTHPVYYFIPPVFASTVCSLLIYLLGRQVASRAVGLIAVLMLLEFDGFVPASSQLRPGVFEAMYMLGAVYLLVLALERAGPPRDRAVIGAAILSFMAWLAKEPTLFFVPGMCLVLLLGGRRWRDLGLYIAMYAALIGLETLAYNVFTIYPHRMAVIMGAHGRNVPAPTDFWYLLTRFTKAEDGWRLTYYFFFASALSLLATRRAFTQKAVVLVCAAFLFLATFGVRRINPIVVWMNMSDRYLTAAVPLALVAAAIVLVEAAAAGRAALTRALASGPRLRVDIGSERWQRSLAAGALGLCLAGMAWKTWVLTAANRAHHPLVETRRLYSLISDAYARGLPIVGSVTRAPKRPGGGSQVRSLHWAVKGFVDERLQLDADGQLPHFSYATSVGMVGKKGRFVPLDPRLSEGVVQRMLKEDPECVLVLKDVGGPTVVTSNNDWHMPARCAPPPG